ncbi:glycosyltransferase [Halococcus agarilyticus]|uniref:glycosyltransferase n=1 Tax=Halococcus agarilyticus TaxID=1232219 RepID=UPI0009AD3A33|nr:glycosyltransferase [Halococcus agarilyticus]
MNAAEEADTARPLVSVVIPAYNDPEGVRVTLESVLAQTYPETSYEIIAVDNGSDDGTQSVIRAFCGQYPDRLSLEIEDEIQGPAAARNAGIRSANGSLLAFIDADMTVEETWLESVVAAMTENDRSYMGCNVELYDDSDEETLVAKYDKTFGFRMERYIEESDFAGTGCLVVRRSVFEEVGTFDDRLRFSADREFGRRVHDAGFDQHFEPSIVMYHSARATVSELIEKSIRTGRGKTHLRTRFPERFETRSLLDPRKYLPPHPVRFYLRATRTEQLSKRDLIGLFAIVYLSKLCRALGELYELAVGHNETLSSKGVQNPSR